jgi:hypothetical protein
LENKEYRQTLKTVIPFLLAANLILPILIIVLLPFQSAAAQNYNYTGQSELPLNYKVKIDHSWLHATPGGLRNATFSSEALVTLNYLGFYEGNGTGFYQRTDRVDECGVRYNLLLEGNATMYVRILPEISEVQVTITGSNLTHVESGGCGGSTNNQEGYVSESYTFLAVDLDTGGTYKSEGYNDYEDDDDRFDQGSTLLISPVGDRLDIVVDKPILNPLDSNPQTKVTVTATRADGAKISNMKVRIELCTVIGKEDTDGHIHDRRNDPCDGGRPHGSVLHNGARYVVPFESMTDSNGQILLDYESAWQQALLKIGKKNPYLKLLYISGEDKIIATKIGDPNLKDQESITTKVQGLAAMPSSVNCSETANYYFRPQGQHGCIFFGTPATNAAVDRIAQSFMDKQDQCKSNPGGQCTLTDAGGNNVTFTITGDNKKLRITAMSLPWGGAHDIKGDWVNPHETHNNGKMIDIGLAELGAAEKDRRLLLWHIISLDSNFGSFAAKEGNPFSYAVDHFHVNFRN